MSLPQPAGSQHDNHEHRIRQLEERTDSASDLLQQIATTVQAIDTKIDRLDAKLTGRMDALDAKLDRVLALVEAGNEK